MGVNQGLCLICGLNVTERNVTALIWNSVEPISSVSEVILVCVYSSLEGKYLKASIALADLPMLAFIR